MLPAVLCELTTITGKRQRRMISFKVSIPFKPGISRSSVTTSGERSSIFFNAKLPSIAVPTTSIRFILFENSRNQLAHQRRIVHHQNAYWFPHACPRAHTACSLPGPRFSVAASRTTSQLIRAPRIGRPRVNRSIERNHVEDQNDAAVAKNGSSAHQIGFDGLIVERLDHKFVLTLKPSTIKPNLRSPLLITRTNTLRRCRSRNRLAAGAQPQQRQDVVTQLQHFVMLDLVDLAFRRCARSRRRHSEAMRRGALPRGTSTRE